jgi:hypothetical protein
MKTKKSPRRGQSTKLIILKQGLDCIVSGLKALYYTIAIFYQGDLKSIIDKIFDLFG